MKTMRQLRDDHRASLRQVQRESGVFAPHLSEIERGVREPSDEELDKLSAYYGVPRDKWKRLLVNVSA